MEDEERREEPRAHGVSIPMEGDRGGTGEALFHPEGRALENEGRSEEAGVPRVSIPVEGEGGGAGKATFHPEGRDMESRRAAPAPVLSSHMEAGMGARKRGRKRKEGARQSNEDSNMKDKRQLSIKEMLERQGIMPKKRSTGCDRVKLKDQASHEVQTGGTMRQNSCVLDKK